MNSFNVILTASFFILISCSKPKDKTQVVQPGLPDSTDQSLDLTYPIKTAVNVSWGDQIVVGNGIYKMDSQQKIRDVLATWKLKFSINDIYWRASSEYMDEFYQQRKDFAREYYEVIDRLKGQFNILNTVRQETSRNAQNFYLYMTIFDHGAPVEVTYGGGTPFPWQDNYTIENPHIQVVDRKGNYQYGVIEMAYPESRNLMVDRLTRYVDRYQADGVYVCLRTHSKPANHADQFGFSKPVVDEFRELYGVDILTDDRFDYLNPGFRLDDPLVEKWRRLRGKYLVSFFAELRQAMPIGKKIIVAIPRGRYLGAPYGNLYLDWESLVKDKLVDGLVIGDYTGKLHNEFANVSHSQLGYLSSEEQNISIPSVEESVTLYGNLCKSNNVDLIIRNMKFRATTIWDQFSNNLGYNKVMMNSPSMNTAVIVQHNEKLNFTSSSFTVEAFVKPSNYGGRIISKYAHDREEYRGWEWVLNSDGTFQFRAQQTNGKSLSVTTDTKLELNQWIHMATVYDLEEGEVRIYLDGALKARQAIDKVGVRNNDQVDLYIGRYGGNDNTVFKGAIDELRISNLSRIYTAQPQMPYSSEAAGTVALFNFNGNTVTDKMGNVHARFTSIPDKPLFVSSFDSKFDKAILLGDN